MIVLDTTVLVYAVGAAHPLRDPCRQIVRAVQSGRVVARTTIDVIQEFAHVRARRRDRHDAALLAHEYASLLQPLILLDDRDLERGLALFQEHDRLGAFDCMLAAAVTRRGADGLVSADRAFDEVAGLRTFDPATDLPGILTRG